MISIHIPSDAVLTREKCLESIKMSHEFFKVYDRRFWQVPYICESWLLSPALLSLLPPDSRILQFQAMFETTYVNEEEDGFMEWVFGRRDIPVHQLPEQTSLQRRMKAYLMNGGRVGEASGRLLDDICQEEKKCF